MIKRAEIDSYTYVWRLWLGLTAFMGAVSAMLVTLLGCERFLKLLQEGPFSLVEQTLVCVLITWLAGGCAAYLLKDAQVRSAHGVTVICSFVILLLFVNILRERIHYADVGDYFRAAQNLHDGQPFHGRYLYPPLLATLCQPLLPWGYHGVAAVLWLANLVSLVAFVWLLQGVLTRYGFGRLSALMVITPFMLVNVPLLRTMSYVQVNLHVLNLILLSMLCYPSKKVWSAVALALAVHLKVTPVVLAIPFLMERDTRWTLAFIAAGFALAGLTFSLYGGAPFFSFVENAQRVYEANGMCFRDNAIDSLIRCVGKGFGMDLTQLVIWLKAPLLLVLAGWIWRVSWRQGIGCSGRLTRPVLEAVPLLFVLMVFISPVVWEHHFVFLALPYLVLVRKLAKPADVGVFGMAYFCTFAIPTFDLLPWSFGRLFGSVLLTYLLFRLWKAPDAPWFAAWRSRVDATPVFAKKGSVDA